MNQFIIRIQRYIGDKRKTGEILKFRHFPQPFCGRTAEKSSSNRAFNCNCEKNRLPRSSFFHLAAESCGTNDSPASFEI